MITWNRVWPRKSGDPSRGLVLEGVRADGSVVAGTAAGPGQPVRVRSDDPALPEFSGRVLAHRWGKRAVLHRDGLFVKLASPGATRRAVERHTAVSASLVPGAPDLVRIVGSGEGFLELAPAAGSDLTGLLRVGDMVACELAGARTGAALASFSAGWAGLPVHDVSDEEAVLKRWVADAEAFGVAPSGLAEAASGAVADLTPADRLVVAHRDLHDGQVLLGDRVTFLDVDTAALADPALDAGNLLAHLDLAAATGARAAAFAMERGFWSTSPHLDPARVGVFRAVARCRIVAVHAFRGVGVDVARELLGTGGVSGASQGS